MRITVMTICSDSYWPLMKLCMPDKLEYCLRHNYQLSIKKCILPIQTFMYEREVLMLEDLKGCDVLVFTGADTLITNLSIKLEHFIENFDFDFLIGKDVNGINNDVFFLKNNERSITFLKWVIDARTTFSTDQDAMKVYVDLKTDFRTVIVPQKLFNAMPYWLYNYKNDGGGTWKPGDFIFHCPGLPFDSRVKVMNEILTKVVR